MTSSPQDACTTGAGAVSLRFMVANTAQPQGNVQFTTTPILMIPNAGTDFSTIMMQQTD